MTEDRPIVCRRSAWTVACLSLVTACAPQVDLYGNGDRVTEYFGYLKVVASRPDGGGTVSSLAVKTLGVRLENGVGVGYFDEKRLFVPLDCRLVIIVANQEQLDGAVKLLEDAKREGVCAFDQPF